MKLLVTGASGFVGRHVATAALDRGHDVRALIRPATDTSRLPQHGHERLEVCRADLRSPRGLTEVAAGVDAVIHLAASMTGDFYARFAGTVIATENLLAAMTETGKSTAGTASSCPPDTSALAPVQATLTLPDRLITFAMSALMEVSDDAMTPTAPDSIPSPLMNACWSSVTL